MTSFYGKVIFFLNEISDLIGKTVIEDAVVSDTSILEDKKFFQWNLK